jgi:hypothetical protein
VLSPERKIMKQYENEKTSEPVFLQFPKQREKRIPET